MTSRGGTLGTEDLAAYEPIARDPVSARFRGADVLTNPPPSSGGILICLCLELLERLGAASVEDVVAVMGAANRSRLGDFHERLYDPGLRARVPRPGEPRRRSRRS